MFRKALQVLAVAAVAALPLAASAQYNGQSNGPYNGNTGDTLLPSQTVVSGTLEQTINTRNAQVGDPFVVDVQPPFPADDNRYQGAKVYGHVASVERAGGMHKAGFVLAFDRLTLSDGTTASLQGQVLSVDTQGNKANSTAKTIAGGVVGMIVGNFIGKHIGTDVGGAIGGAGGAILAANSGQNVQVNQGSTVSMKTTAPATVLSRRQAGYPNGYQNNGNPNNGNPNNGNAYPTPYPTPYH
jgi:outer membrane lipoprotein SlyB